MNAVFLIPFFSGTPCGTAAQVAASNENHGRLLHIRDFSLGPRPLQLQHGLCPAAAANHVSHTCEVK